MLCGIDNIPQNILRIHIYIIYPYMYGKYDSKQILVETDAPNLDLS
jgi:hypothetical protein